MVAAPRGLRGVERLADADGHQRVLELRARARVGVDVARGHAREAEAAGELLQAAVALAVAAVEGALELDPQPVAAEGVAQAPQRRLVVDPALRRSR